MSGDFLTFWFRGLQTAFTQLDESGMDTLMTHCGRACSDSYPKQVYLDAYRAADTLDGFLDGLNARFGGTVFRRVGCQTVEAIYTRCGCDLVREGYITDPRLCLCSLKSLQYNWESVLGEYSVVCTLIQSILGGGDCCRFLIKINPETAARLLESSKI